MKNKLTLAVACAALAGMAHSAGAVSLDILFVANSNNTAFQTFATSGQFAGSTWTQIGTGLTGNVVGGDLDRTATLGGISQTVKSYLESFDLVILSTPISSANYVDSVSGADWAAITTPILSTATFAFRSTGGRIGLISGVDQSPYTFTDPLNETTRVSSSALSDRVFAGTTSQTNLLTAGVTQGDVVFSATIGGGEVLATVTSTLYPTLAPSTTVAPSIGYWSAGATTATSQTLVGSRALFALKGGYADLNTDGQIVMSNLILEVTGSAIPEPSAFAALAGFGALGFAASRRRRA
jgi:hypothetical protein